MDEVLIGLVVTMFLCLIILVGSLIRSMRKCAVPEELLNQKRLGEESKKS